MAIHGIIQSNETPCLDAGRGKESARRGTSPLRKPGVTKADQLLGLDQVLLGDDNEGV